jgi:hypothetical protein
VDCGVRSFLLGMVALAKQQLFINIIDDTPFGREMLSSVSLIICESAGNPPKKSMRKYASPVHSRLCTLLAS